MVKPFKLKSHLCRFSKIFSIGDKNIPKNLFLVKNEKPDLTDFPYPLPSKKSDYICFAETNGIKWFGASNGLTRYDENAEREIDKIMFFSAPRDLPDNNVKAVMPENGGVWVLTETGAAFIEMKLLSAEEKADILLRETLKCVDRRGMVSQKKLAEPRNLDSALPYGHSDNDGCFTAGFSIGEIFKYAVLKREKGANHPETIAAKKVATRSCEACLLLLQIHKRGDGFVARTYLVSDEPVPDDGIFFKIDGDKAYCLDTTLAQKRNCVGAQADASAAINKRLAKLYTDSGYTDNDIIYKADTSSDEVTLHFLNMLVAHEYLACDDPELDEIIVSSVKLLMNHIIDNGYELHDFTGKATSWAKWCVDYFNTDFGWVDGALNSAQLLMYLLVTMRITGEEGKWKEQYNHLVNDLGYADMTQKHFDRLYQTSILAGIDYQEDIMYGDHMLATAAFWVLCTLEKDEELLKKYKNGFKSWRTSTAREFNPGYDLPYALSCGDDDIDYERLADWFYRISTTRLAAGVNLTGRHDIPTRTFRNGKKEISVVLPPDEVFIAKYDRNPLDYVNEDSGGYGTVESCYVYTFAYWIGRYYGFFE